MTGRQPFSAGSQRDEGPRGVTVLGATGSIGESTLDVVARHPERFRVLALTAHTRVERLRQQCLRHRPRFAVVSSAADAGRLADDLAADGLETEVLHGPGGLDAVAGHADASIVVTGIVGAAGLLPTLAAVAGPRRVLIANKEPLVMMGAAILAAASHSGAAIVPLDSEHNAVFQCLPAGQVDGGVRRILLTASGGPFRNTPLADLQRVTPQQAVAHPNWSMGPKISVDSATLMNKGLEMIEACALFGVTVDRVQVVIHPQSTIHSMVEFVDGSVLAQMGAADMRIPIAHGLGWPERIESGADRLQFATDTRFDFDAPDEHRFPCLRLAREAAAAGGSVPIVLNAANEIAVAAFLDGRIGFTAIPAIIEATIDGVAPAPAADLDTVLDFDRRGRAVAERVLQGHAR